MELMVYFESSTDNEGVIMVNEKLICTYGYDPRQRTYLCLIKTTDYAKGFKTYYHRNPSGLVKQIATALNNKKLNLENISA